MVEVGGEVLFGIEGDGLGRIDGQELLQVKDLNTVANSLRSDNDVVLVGSDLAPLGGHRVLRKAAEVDHLAVLANLDEGSTLELTNTDKLTAIIGGPTPRRGTLCLGTTKGFVAQKVMEVNVVTLEGVEPVSGDGLSPAIDTLGITKLRILRLFEGPGLSCCLPSFLSTVR